MRIADVSPTCTAVNLLITCGNRWLKATVLGAIMIGFRHNWLHRVTSRKRILAFVLACMLPIFSHAQGQEMALKKVVIDPGHGGSDPGAVGPTKKYEKNVVLAVSLFLGEMIKKEYPDVEVIYTRDNDKFVGLAERAELANKVKADLFISIHANAATNPSAYGSESWVLGLHKSAAALEVAKRENAVITLEEDYQNKYESFNPSDPESYIWLSMRQNAFLDQSIRLAGSVQNQFTNGIKRFNRGVKQAGFLVLYRTTMPSILVEIGFISNPKEEAWMASETGQKEISASLFRAFDEYKKSVDGVNAELNGEKSHSPPTDNQTSTKNGEDQAKNTQGDGISNGKVPDSKHVVFSVQVMATPKPVEMVPQNFGGHTDVVEYISGGLYKYSIGRCATFTEVMELQKKLRSEGYDSAFVIAFLNGERIDLNKARELAKQ